MHSSSGIDFPYLAFFLAGFFIILLITPVSAVTLTNPRFNESMTAGSTIAYDFSFIPDTEPSVTFERIDITGDCAAWISLDKQAPLTFTERIPLQAVIAVPKDATNGWHRCDVTFTTPSAGMFVQAMAIPISVNVTGGTAPTAAITTAATIAPTTQAPVTTAPVQQQSEAPGIGIGFVMGAGIMFFIFVVVILWDIRRARR